MEATDSDAHVYNKEETLREYMADLEEISDTASNVSDEVKSENSEISIKVRRGISKPKDECYIKYIIFIGDKKVKIECYGTVSNVGNYIRCPYSGIRSNDKVGSIDENHYFKAHLPFISKGDNHMTFYYDTPEAFERHHMTILSKEIKNRWYAQRK